MKTPTIDQKAVILKGAVVVGDVTIGQDSSVWYNAVIRGDENDIHIGKRTNVQDCSVIHVNSHDNLMVGDQVTIGHNAILHGCTIGNDTLIGMGSIILDGARIGSNCMIGAGSLVTQNKVIPDGSLAFGNPAKVIRTLTPKELQSIQESAEEYVQLSKEHQPS